MFLSSQNSGNFLRKEPHIAYRGRSRSFEADLEADLEAEIEAAEADLEAVEAAQGHPRPLQATNKPGIYETNLEEGLVTLNNLEEGLVTLNNLEEDLVTQQFRRRFGDSKQKVPTTN